MRNFGTLTMERLTAEQIEIQNAVSYKSRKRDTIAGLESKLKEQKEKLDAYQERLENGKKLDEEDTRRMQRLQTICNDLQALVNKERKIHNIH